MIPVNVDRVCILCQWKDLPRITELPKSLNRCVCQQKNGIQQKKPVYDTWYKKKEKKLRTRSSEYPNLEENVAQENVSSFKNMNGIANGKLI